MILMHTQIFLFFWYLFCGMFDPEEHMQCLTIPNHKDEVILISKFDSSVVEHFIYLNLRVGSLFSNKRLQPLTETW